MGEGAQTIMCAKPLIRQGSRARLRALEPLGFQMLLSEPYFEAFCYKMGGGGGRKPSIDQQLGERGRAPVAPLPGTATGSRHPTSFCLDDR